MGLETGTTISQLDATWPLGGDQKSQGDNHVRLIKSVLKTQFPGAGGLGLNVPIIATESDLNALSSRAAFLVTKSADQSIPLSTPTDLTWSTEILDSKNGFASNQYVVPSLSGGLWIFGARTIVLASQSSMELSLKVNGSLKLGSTHFGSGTTNQLLLAGVALVAAGDIIKVSIVLSSSASSVWGGSGAGETNFWGFKVI